MSFEAGKSGKDGGFLTNALAFSDRIVHDLAFSSAAKEHSVVTAEPSPFSTRLSGSYVVAALLMELLLDLFSLLMTHQY